jgi:hypothetical protein
MRQQILAHVHDKGGEGLEEIVIEAIKQHLNNKEAKLQASKVDAEYLGQ